MAILLNWIIAAVLSPFYSLYNGSENEYEQSLRSSKMKQRRQRRKQNLAQHRDQKSDDDENTGEEEEEAATSISSTSPTTSFTTPVEVAKPVDVPDPAERWSGPAVGPKEHTEKNNSHTPSEFNPPSPNSSPSCPPAGCSALDDGSTPPVGSELSPSSYIPPSQRPSASAATRKGTKYPVSAWSTLSKEERARKDGDATTRPRKRVVQRTKGSGPASSSTSPNHKATAEERDAGISTAEVLCACILSLFLCLIRARDGC